MIIQQPIAFGRGVCYSGYRTSHSPITRRYPSDAEVLEDLQILVPHFDYLRMYDTSWHAYSVLRVIQQHHLPLKVMLGAEGGGEISNPNCPWGGLHSEEEIAYNRLHNYAKLDELALLARTYPEIVLAVSVGNESTSLWQSNLLTPETIADYVRYIKPKVPCPVTFCEGAHYYRLHGQVIAKEVDFLSIHCYPVWMKIPFADAVDETIKDIEATHQMYPDKQIVVTEFGWPTSANKSMNAEETTEANQAVYLKQMAQWSQAHQLTMFVFEAFDEPWKGGNDPIEPEKHWGIYSVDRLPKQYTK